MSSLVNSPRGREFGTIGKTTLPCLHVNGARSWIIRVDDNGDQRSKPTSADAEVRREIIEKNKALFHTGQDSVNDAPATDHEHDHVRGENEGT